MNYVFKTEPFKHQLAELESSGHKISHAIHWEQGTGKTKLAIDNIGMLYSEGLIDGALIVAPNGIDLNWLIDEIPTHLPDAIKARSNILRWATKSRNTKRQKGATKWNLNFNGLAWLIMSYDAFMTIEGKVAALTFAEKRKTFYVLDESTRIKTPGAKRTQRIVKTGWRALYRRTLTGTPTPKGAFDIYSQINFLDNDFWKRHNMANFAMFKAYFGVFENTFARGGGGEKTFEKLVAYQRLDELARIIAPMCSRVLKRDVLDLPPKIYQSRYFHLTKQQRSLYNDIENEFRTYIKETNQLITANLAMVRLLRLQQISCGYLPTGEDEPVHMIEGDNPRLDLIEEIIEDFEDKMIIFARYRLDIDLIKGLMVKHNKSFVIYDGRTSDADRIKAKADFQKGDTQYFIANPSVAGEGITLHAANNVLYYSNSFNLNHRLQSEDRAHRAGQTKSVNYIDLLGIDTIDKRIMLNLCNKMNVSDQVLGDTPGMDIRTQLEKWLTMDEIEQEEEWVE